MKRLQPGDVHPPVSCFRQPQRFSLRGRSPRCCGLGFSETPHGTRDNTDFPGPVRKSDARLRLASRPSPGVTACRTRGVLVVRATPSFLPLVRHRGGVSSPPFGPPFTPLLRGGRSLHTDPCGKATKPMRKPSTKILVDSDAAVGTGHVAWACFPNRAAIPCWFSSRTTIPAYMLSSPSGATPNPPPPFFSLASSACPSVASGSRLREEPVTRAPFPHGRPPPIIRPVDRDRQAVLSHSSTGEHWNSPRPSGWTAGGSGNDRNNRSDQTWYRQNTRRARGQHYGTRGEGQGRQGNGIR